MYNRRLRLKAGGRLAGVAGLALLTACGQTTPTPPAGVSPTAPESATAAPTLARVDTPMPTATAEPLAARVNGLGIPLAWYEAETQRCQAANAYPDCPARALQSLVEQAVVEQAAQAAGLAVSDAEVEAALAQIRDEHGGAPTYADWLAANFYTEETLREALRREMLRARQVEQVTASVGETAEQVHALAILVADEATARSLLDQLKSGADFATLALAYSLDLSSRVAGGDLGWFPRGVLTMPEVEQAAFALQPGETSDVIHSALGYVIVHTLALDPARALSPGARQTLRERTYRAWLDSALAKATIEKLVNP